MPQNIIIDSEKFYYQVDDFPLSKAVTLDNGFVRWIAPIARVSDDKGFLNLDKSGKPYFQKVSRDLLEKTKGSFVGLPATLGHPKELITLANSHLIKGMGSTGKDTVFQVDNYQFSLGTLYDQDLIELIKSKAARQISPGYKVKLKPLDVESDTVEQVDRQGNHIAFVPYGRGGDSVALQLDSSDFEWDFSSQSQFDDSELNQIRQEILGIPENFLDLSYAQESINLDAIDLTPSVHNKGKLKGMPKLQLVNDQGTVITVESEQQTQLDELQSFVGRLKVQKDEAIIQATSQELTQTDSAESVTKIAALEAQIEVLTVQNDKPVVQMDQAEVLKMAVQFMEIAPYIHRIDPEFQFDSVANLTDLKKAFIIRAMPSKTQEIEALQLDDSAIGQINQGRITGLYEVLISQAKTQLDNAPILPTAPKERDFNGAFKALLGQGAATQLDESEADLVKAREQISNAWKTN